MPAHRARDSRTWSARRASPHLERPDREVRRMPSCPRSLVHRWLRAVPVRHGEDAGITCPDRPLSSREVAPTDQDGSQPRPQQADGTHHPYPQGRKVRWALPRNAGTDSNPAATWAIPMARRSGPRPGPRQHAPSRWNAPPGDGGEGETLQILFAYARAMALVGLLESLMTAKLVDDGTHTHSNKSRES